MGEDDPRIQVFESCLFGRKCILLAFFLTLEKPLQFSTISILEPVNQPSTSGVTVTGSSRFFPEVFCFSVPKKTGGPRHHMVILCGAKWFEMDMEVHPNAGGRVVGSCGWREFFRKLSPLQIRPPGKQVAVNFHQLYP